METFFQPGVTVMEQAILAQKAAAHVPVTVRAVRNAYHSKFLIPASPSCWLADLLPALGCFRVFKIDFAKQI
jgi:hypothetical protein